MQPEYISREGYLTLNKYIEDLKSTLNNLREQQQVSRQQETGDESENSELMRLTAEINQIGSKVQELNIYCSNCTIVDIDNLNAHGKAIFGSKVTVLDMATNQASEYQILGEKESNPKLSKISYKSPLGAALIGLPVGEYLEIKTPSGFKEYEILSIA